MMKKIFFSIALALTLTVTASAEEFPLTKYVDLRIGSEGLGRVFIGPTCPFGMVKPSPDCTPAPNNGWDPMPTRVDGFAQTHISGTGGGQKYGNILVQPFCTGMNQVNHYYHRAEEHFSLGYYDTRYQENGIRTEITTAERASLYRFTYPKDSLQSLAIDAGFFLGENPVPDAREAQQFVGSEVNIISDTEVEGYTRIRGGWNNGRAYTVYFYAQTDRPFIRTATWKGDSIYTDRKEQYDSYQKTGALLRFGNESDQVHLKVGISFLSTGRAKHNAHADLPDWSFEEVHRRLLAQWEHLLSRIEIADNTPEERKRMFYTAIYHALMMPADRTGENPLWNDPQPYYDDYYAIWDTYRTSTPLLTLIDPKREADLVQSLLYIYKRDGYLPDARSGNCNGRTQGGSNAEIMIADAYVKGLTGIDWDLALEAMLKDATVDPGGHHEAEGRGGLDEYLRLGYVPWGIPRAGNRTVEYSYCDYAIYLVAKGMGKKPEAKRELEEPVAKRLRARRRTRLHHASRRRRQLAGQPRVWSQPHPKAQIRLHAHHLGRPVVHPLVGHLLLRRELLGILAQRAPRRAGAHHDVRRSGSLRTQAGHLLRPRLLQRKQRTRLHRPLPLPLDRTPRPQFGPRPCHRGPTLRP